MMGIQKTLTVGAVLVSAIAWPHHELRAQPPTFRASANLVAVDVSVLQNNRPVVGLTSTDFLVEEDGASQVVRMVDLAQLPLDVTAIIDIGRYAGSTLSNVRDDLSAVVRDLKPDDRFRLLTSGTDVRQPIVFTRVDERLPTFASFELSPWSALHEALVAALLHDVTPDRRHLIVAFSDGLDTASAISASVVQAVAARSESVLYLVVPSAGEPRGLRDAFIMAGTFSDAGPPEFPRTLNGEVRSEFRNMLVEAAESSGGARYTTGGTLRGASLVQPLRKIIDAYRSGYLITYQPLQQPSAGWHGISVRVRGRPRATVHARRGYFVNR
jgi:VWFA-related protein